MLAEKPVDGRRRAHRVPKPVPSVGIFGGVQQGLGKRGGIANRKVQPVTIRSDLLRHPADVAADEAGLRWARASSMTSGEFSHQIDGTTTQSMSAISRERSLCSYGPARWVCGADRSKSR